MDATQRAIAAQHLLENELLKEVLNTLDAEYHLAWRNSQTVEAREDCYRHVKIIERFISDLKSVVNTGRIAEARRNEAEGGSKWSVRAWK